MTAADIQTKLNAVLESQLDFGIQYWPMFLKQSDQHIGCCRVRPKNADDGILEFGIHLRPEHWGNGLAVEAGVAMARHVFARKFMFELFAGHHPWNRASRHLLRKLGFTYIGDKFYPLTGLQHPSYRLKPVTNQGQTRKRSDVKFQVVYVIMIGKGMTTNKVWLPREVDKMRHQ